MLKKGILSAIGLDLLAFMCRVSHGDEIIIMDVYFLRGSFNDHVLQVDSVLIKDRLNGILPLLPLDWHVVSSLYLRDAVGGNVLDPELKKYRNVTGMYDFKDVNINSTGRIIFSTGKTSF